MKNKHGVFAYICLILYFFSTCILIGEASVKGEESANKSNTVGEALGNFFNTINGDQTTIILPESIEITNKIYDGIVGDSYQLEIETFPYNSTYKSLIFTSSSPEIASIDNKGLIKFLRAGKTIIEVKNEKIPSVKYSFELEVFDVFALSFITKIDNAETDNDIYYLKLGETYQIKNVFSPITTTYKNVTYIYDEEYLYISSDGVISTLKNTMNNVIEITVNYRDISKVLNIKIDSGDIVHLKNISFYVNNYTVFISQKVAIDVLYTPSNATYKEYTISSLTPDLLVVEDNLYIKGLKEGTATVKITSDIYNISKTVSIKVKPFPTLEDFTLKNQTLFVDEEINLFCQLTPEYSLINSKSYEIEDPSIISIDDNGLIKGLSTGSTTLTVNLNGIIKSNLITVYNYDSTNTLEISVKKSNLYIGVKYGFSELFSINNKNEKDIVYSLENEENVVLTENTIRISCFGKYKVFVTDKKTNLSQYFMLECVPFDFKFVDENDNEVTSLELIVGKKYTYKIIDENKQEYRVRFGHDYFNYDYDYDKKTIELTPKTNGETTINIFPIASDGKEATPISIPINIKHIYTNQILYRIINENTGKEVLLQNDTLYVYLNDYYSIKSFITQESTISKYSYSIGNSEFLEIDYRGIFIFKKIGKTSVTIKEGFSGLSYKFNVVISNRLELNEDAPFNVKGDTLLKIDDNHYSIVNGYSATVNFNFLDTTTFKEVSYSSSNLDVASIGNDGIITPLKSGTTIIKLNINDNFNINTTYEFELDVKKQNIIQNIEEFNYKVRKGIGHFAAFMVLGIFSTLTYVQFFDKKKKILFGLIINFISGFFIASLTELIQAIVPGRFCTFNDVILDFEGFLCSSIITLIIYYLILFIKMKKARKI